MRMVRDVTSLDRVLYLGRLGLEPDEVGRLALVEGEIGRTGLYVNGVTGESRFFREGDLVPEGVWVANREIEDVRPGAIDQVADTPGFGEGWGAQGEQFGGVPEDVDPFVGDAAG